MFAPMRLRQLYNNFLTELKPLYEYEESAAVSTMIFEHFAGKNRADIISDPDFELLPENVSELEFALLELKRHVPVQYIIGHAWFMNRKYKVTDAVLIPRPETEELVLKVLDFCQANNKKKVIDIGTGSGCISISIKTALPQLNVSAVDISEAALAVAKENAAANNATIHFIQQDFLQEEKWKELGVYDVIISNPPYIPENEKAMLDSNVTAHEPHLALFVPDNQALIFYEKIAVFAKNHLAAHGCIFMETHESFAGAVANHFNQNGFEAIVQKDFFEKERMVIASRFR